MKRAYYYRCHRRIRSKGKDSAGRNKHCGGRKTLRKPIEQYLREQKCPLCHHKGSLRLDNWRKKNERGRCKQKCICDGLPYPHRRGSKWCNHYAGEYDEYDMMYRPMERTT